MPKITVIIGTASKKYTLSAVNQFLDNLKSLGNIETEIVVLSDYTIDICRGCKACFEKGEEFCPMKDDRDVIVGKMIASDGVVFASPNYAFQVSGFMKVFLDRIAFIFHRPRFFGKTFTSIVAQGIYGGGKIVSYFDFVGNSLGFNTIQGLCLTALEPMSENEKRTRDKKLADLSRKFYRELIKAEYPSPTLFKLMGFRMGRTSIRLELDETSRDYTYYRDKGWFESDYYYPTRLNFMMKAIGKFFDTIQARMTRKRITLHED